MYFIFIGRCRRHDFTKSALKINGWARVLSLPRTKKCNAKKKKKKLSRSSHMLYNKPVYNDVTAGIANYEIKSLSQTRAQHPFCPAVVYIIYKRLFARNRS